MTKVDIADRVRIRAMKACTSGDMELFNLLVEVLNRFESTNRFYGTPLTALGLTVRTHNIREIEDALQCWNNANQSEQEQPR